MQDKKLLKYLFETADYLKENRTKKFLKEYFGIIPTLSGFLIAGVAGTITQVIGTIYSISEGACFSSALAYGSDLAGKVIAPGFIAGQFTGYKIKKMITSFFKK